MKTSLFAILLLATHYSFSQSKIGPKDPCFADSKSIPCQEKIRQSLFFITSVDGTIRPEEASYVDAYFKKYGIDGFFLPASQYRPGSLLEFAMDTSKHKKINEKLIRAFPKGGSLDGKNIFDIVVKEYPPFTRTSDMKSYIESLEVLFPKEGNEDFQKTKDQFGLPWGEPLFPQKYLDRIKGVVAAIDHHNEFFRKSEFLPEKNEFLKIIARIEELQKIPSKACSVSSYEDYVVMRDKFGDVFRSNSEDIIGCMIKNGKYELVEKIISDNDYTREKLPGYFDLAVAAKETPETFKLSQLLYLKLAQRNQKINPIKGEAQRDFLQRGSVYLNKYHQEETICEIQYHEGITINELSKDLNSILFVQAYQLMEKILNEKDAKKKADLVEQFLQLRKVGANLAQAHPDTGKTILHLIAQAGDNDLFNKLSNKGVYPGLIGDKVLDKNGKSPMIVAIEVGELNNLKFATSLFREGMYTKAVELKEMKKALNKIKTSDKEVKDMSKSLIWKIKDELFDAE